MNSIHILITELTKYIIDNGFNAYLHWHDYESWYPEGRFVPTTSQVALHLIAATAYKIFGFGSSLLDFVIMFPVIIGSLTTIVIFALVRNLAGIQLECLRVYCSLSCLR